jgi:hypothetical protein
LEIIRVLSRENKTEIFFQKRKEYSPVESIHTVSISIINEFIESWQNWLKQIDALSYALPDINHNYIDRFTEFSKSLQSILFGNYPIRFSKTVVWIMDKDLMSLPVEILKIHKEQRFYRNIRSLQIPPVGKKAKEYLFVENQHSAESLISEMNLERKEILEFWNTKNISYKELKGTSCTRARFIEKIASVKVLHYSGHSFEDGLWFSDVSKLEISDLSKLNLSNLELVSLNSCSSAIGLARGFLEAGAKECVGFLGPVRNDISRQVGKIFWETYCTTNSASLAVEKVRDELQRIHGEGYPAAYQFVHFGIPESKSKYWIQNKKLIFLILFCFGLINLLMYKYFTSSMLETSYNGKELNPKNQEIQIKKEENVIQNEAENRIRKDFVNNLPNQKKSKPNFNNINNKYSDSKSKNLQEKIDNIPIKNYKFTDVSNERLEKYISALNSESLKNNIWKYINKKDSIVSTDKKREKIEKILESTESEELIEYKLRELE